MWCLRHIARLQKEAPPAPNKPNLRVSQSADRTPSPGYSALDEACPAIARILHAIATPPAPLTTHLCPTYIVQFTTVTHTQRSLPSNPTTMAAPTYPPGGTFFDTLKKSFVDVPVDTANDNAIDTQSFLEAAEALTTLFGESITTSTYTSYTKAHNAKHHTRNRRPRLRRLQARQGRHEHQHQENPRPLPRRPRRRRHAAGPRALRAGQQEAHRDRGSIMAEQVCSVLRHHHEGQSGMLTYSHLQRSRLHRPSPSQER